MRLMGGVKTLTYMLPRMQDIIERRKGAAVRGEVLSWLVFMQTMANVVGPLILGTLAAISIVDGRVAFYVCAATSVAAAALIILMDRELHPSSGSDAAERAKRWTLPV